MHLPKYFPVTAHTQHVGPGCTYVAIQGQHENGVKYIFQALEQGAKKIVVHNSAQLDGVLHKKIEECGAHLERVSNTRKALARLSAQACGNPAQKLKIFGITGTKGKTTSAYVLEQIFTSAGYKTARLSTAGNAILGEPVEGALTTPQPDYLHMFLRACVSFGVTHVVMEVSAQAMSLHRVEDIFFDGIIFTNFDQEHAEFYDSQEKYFQAKCALLKQVKQGAPIILNSDDLWVQKIIPEYLGAQLFSLENKQANFFAQEQSTSLASTKFTLEHNGVTHEYTSNTLLGKYNIYNITGCIALAYKLGIKPECIQSALDTCLKIPGRFEKYSLANGATCIIDYAHNPSSYRALFSLLRACTNNLILVFGAGGERDHDKRPVMGAIAAQFANLIILTSDNPRSENPEVIIQDIMQGIPQEKQRLVIVELDRAQAIEKACELSKEGSIIALLGKGNDEYQLVNGIKTPFSEKQLIESLLHR